MFHKSIRILNGLIIPVIFLVTCAPPSYGIVINGGGTPNRAKNSKQYSISEYIQAAISGSGAPLKAYKELWKTSANINSISNGFSFHRKDVAKSIKEEKNTPKSKKKLASSVLVSGESKSLSYANENGALKVNTQLGNNKNMLTRSKTFKMPGKVHAKKQESSKVNNNANKKNKLQLKKSHSKVKIRIVRGSRSGNKKASKGSSQNANPNQSIFHNSKSKKTTSNAAKKQTSQKKVHLLKTKRKLKSKQKFFPKHLDKNELRQPRKLNLKRKTEAYVKNSRSKPLHENNSKVKQRSLNKKKQFNSTEQKAKKKINMNSTRKGKKSTKPSLRKTVKTKISKSSKNCNFSACYLKVGHKVSKKYLHKNERSSKPKKTGKYSKGLKASRRSRTKFSQKDKIIKKNKNAKKTKQNLFPRNIIKLNKESSTEYSSEAQSNFDENIYPSFDPEVSARTISDMIQETPTEDFLTLEDETIVSIPENTRDKKKLDMKYHLKNSKTKKAEERKYYYIRSVDSMKEAPSYSKYRHFHNEKSFSSKLPSKLGVSKGSLKTKVSILLDSNEEKPISKNKRRAPIIMSNNKSEGKLEPSTSSVKIENEKSNIANKTLEEELKSLEDYIYDIENANSSNTTPIISKLSKSMDKEARKYKGTSEKISKNVAKLIGKVKEMIREDALQKTEWKRILNSLNLIQIKGFEKHIAPQKEKKNFTPTKKPPSNSPNPNPVKYSSSFKTSLVVEHLSTYDTKEVIDLIVKESASFLNISKSEISTKTFEPSLQRKNDTLSIQGLIMEFKCRGKLICSSDEERFNEYIKSAGMEHTISKSKFVGISIRLRSLAGRPTVNEEVLITQNDEKTKLQKWQIAFIGSSGFVGLCIIILILFMVFKGRNEMSESSLSRKDTFRGANGSNRMRWSNNDSEDLSGSFVFSNFGGRSRSDSGTSPWMQEPIPSTLNSLSRVESYLNSHFRGDGNQFTRDPMHYDLNRTDEEKGLERTPTLRDIHGRGE